MARFSVHLPLGLAVLSLQACATSLAPQAVPGIPMEAISRQGAMADVSRAWRLGFYADPGGQPEVLPVDTGLGGTHVLAAQWTTDLARVMNVVVGRAELLDERFKERAVEVFSHEISNGDVIYRWRAPATGAEFGKARVATLRLTKLSAAATTDGVRAQGVLEVTMPGFVHLYACEVIEQRHWMANLMGCLGGKVVGDPQFWQGAAKVE